jgi:GT2 family glycosyltransferase
LQLSVIIVNYNVKHFLLQCLRSVYAAVNDLEMEVFVVDNVSKDGSVEAVRAAFPQVKLIANTENVGFSKANNQAIAQATGEYVLILNPDTVVAEDTFVKCIAHMLSYKDAGCLGVHMIDGKGVFLPESKRGLPTPEVAFYKMFGFSSLFPKSKRFGKYHLGYLSENETHEVDILSGAFMFFRKEVLDKIGGFDETFFMYGEDIDLSWRVVLGGYKNYYLADVTIIHYKGESTKRGSLNYVKVFYEAMIIFAKKHFANSKASLFSFFINVAVVFRAILTILANVISSSFVVVVDFLLIYAGLFFTTNFWANNFKSTIDYYPQIFLAWACYRCIYSHGCMGAYLSGGYEKPFRLSGIVKGILASTFIIAFVYAFLPETWRFSRAIIVFGAIVAMTSLTITRLFYNMVKHGRLSFDEQLPKRWLVVGDESESNRAIELLKKYEEPELTYVLKTANTLNAKAKLLGIDEIVFCSETVPFRTIIDSIEETKGQTAF